MTFPGERVAARLFGRCARRCFLGFVDFLVLRGLRIDRRALRVRRLRGLRGEREERDGVALGRWRAPS
jgi:hypothetical protein